MYPWSFTFAPAGALGAVSAKASAKTSVSTTPAARLRSDDRLAVVMEHSSGDADSPRSGGRLGLRFQRILQLFHDIFSREARHHFFIPSWRHFHMNVDRRQVLLIAAAGRVCIHLQAAHSSSESDQRILHHAALFEFRYSPHDYQRFP